LISGADRFNKSLCASDHSPVSDCRIPSASLNVSSSSLWSEFHCCPAKRNEIKSVYSLAAILAARVSLDITRW